MSSEAGGKVRRLIASLALLGLGFVGAGWRANRVRVSLGEIEQVRGVVSHGDAPVRKRGRVWRNSAALPDGVSPCDTTPRTCSISPNETRTRLLASQPPTNPSPSSASEAISRRTFPPLHCS